MTAQETQRIIDSITEACRSDSGRMSPEELSRGWDCLERALDQGKAPNTRVLSAVRRCWLPCFALGTATLLVVALYRVSPAAKPARPYDIVAGASPVLGETINPAAPALSAEDRVASRETSFQERQADTPEQGQAEPAAAPAPPTPGKVVRVRTHEHAAHATLVTPKKIARVRPNEHAAHAALVTPKKVARIRADEHDGATLNSSDLKAQSEPAVVTNDGQPGSSRYSTASGVPTQLGEASRLGNDSESFKIASLTGQAGPSGPPPPGKVHFGRRQ